jgi:hypothetical protein
MPCLPNERPAIGHIFIPFHKQTPPQLLLVLCPEAAVLDKGCQVVDGALSIEAEQSTSRLLTYFSLSPWFAPPELVMPVDVIREAI